MKWCVTCPFVQQTLLILQPSLSVQDLYVRHVKIGRANGKINPFWNAFSSPQIFDHFYKREGAANALPDSSGIDPIVECVSKLIRHKLPRTFNCSLRSAHKSFFKN